MISFLFVLVPRWLHMLQNYVELMSKYDPARYCVVEAGGLEKIPKVTDLKFRILLQVRASESPPFPSSNGLLTLYTPYTEEFVYTLPQAEEILNDVRDLIREGGGRLICYQNKKVRQSLSQIQPNCCINDDVRFLEVLWRQNVVRGDDNLTRRSSNLCSEHIFYLLPSFYLVSLFFSACPPGESWIVLV